MNQPYQSHLRTLFYNYQNGVCPICQEKLEGKVILDHNHVTGEIRGLLCPKDNNRVAQIETGTKKMNYTMHRNTVSRIEAYLKSYPKLKLV